LLLIRHGQSEFNRHYNATGRDPGIADPDITDIGYEQAQYAAEILAACGVHTVIASPYTRALQTAAVIADDLGAQMLVEPLVRERCAFICDIGRPRAELEAAWPQLNFGSLEEIWWHQGTEPGHVVARRARDFRLKACSLPEHEGVAIVSHWGFILELTGHALENGRILRFDPNGRRGTVPVG
jgi:broad specificity phosphatase PhoE